MTSITALPIANGSARKKSVRKAILPINKKIRLPMLNEIRELSLVCVIKPIDDTKGENGTIPNGAAHMVIKQPAEIEILPT